MNVSNPSRYTTPTERGATWGAVCLCGLLMFIAAVSVAVQWWQA